MKVKLAITLDAPPKFDTLFEKTVRLAYAKPELRANLLPVLKKTARDLGRNEIDMMHQKRGTFGVLSAYTGRHSKKENKDRHGELIRDLQIKGHRNWKDAQGYWGYREKSVIVPDIAFHDLLELGDKYDQDAVIFKSNDGVVGMYSLKGGSVQIAAPEIEYYDDDEGVTEFRQVSMSYEFIEDLQIPLRGSPVDKNMLRQMNLAEDYPQIKALLDDDDVE